MNGSALRQEKGLDGAALKWIAMCSMLIDHIGAVVLEYGLYYEGGAKGFRRLAEGPWGNEIEIGAWFLRVLGRPAFMIYCFLLVEGFIHTRNRMKYGKNLLIFSLISEIPFDLAVGNGLFVPEYQNVFFELFIGFGVLSALERVKLRECGSGIAQTPRDRLCCGRTFAGRLWGFRNPDHSGILSAFPEPEKADRCCSCPGIFRVLWDNPWGRRSGGDSHWSV